MACCEATEEGVCTFCLALWLHGPTPVCIVSCSLCMQQTAWTSQGLGLFALFRHVRADVGHIARVLIALCLERIVPTPDWGCTTVLLSAASLIRGCGLKHGRFASIWLLQRSTQLCIRPDTSVQYWSFARADRSIAWHSAAQNV